MGVRTLESKEKEKCGENAIAMRSYAIVKICDCMRSHEVALRSHEATVKFHEVI